MPISYEICKDIKLYAQNNFLEDEVIFTDAAKRRQCYEITKLKRFGFQNPVKSPKVNSREISSFENFVELLFFVVGNSHNSCLFPRGYALLRKKTG